MLLELADVCHLPAVRQCAVRLLGMLPTCPATLKCLQVTYALASPAAAHAHALACFTATIASLPGVRGVFGLESTPLQALLMDKQHSQPSSSLSSQPAGSDTDLLVARHADAWCSAGCFARFCARCTAAASSVARSARLCTASSSSSALLPGGGMPRPDRSPTVLYPARSCAHECSICC